jgi:hypothetical protein
LKKSNIQNCIQRNSHEGVHRRVEKFKKQETKKFQQITNLIKNKRRSEKIKQQKIKFRTKSSIWKVKTNETNLNQQKIFQDFHVHQLQIYLKLNLDKKNSDLAIPSKKPKI